ncbi:helix-turn-helix transcriptional regulator [Cupriavidus basilensis]|uniref:Helix-turn-helix transcriptional regulator n=1 Tax=Cupriavidus basilensis TaxID=68895 RepID=A0ABT6AFY3_9BURK|nr:helix-turn-helix transcriptional regulator [Cupriavidus basilensis]MDF3831369.1 helix-turn-helix transcriptional regulator [Cupriavidus basilensis]
MPAGKPAPKSTNPLDYQHAARPAAVMPKEFPDGFVVAAHRHERAQLIYAVAGVIEVTAGHALWLLPTQRALWMPPGLEHGMRARGAVSLRTLYIRPETCPAATPAQPRLVNVSPLLRELVLRAASLPLDHAPGGREDRLMRVLLDELEWSPEQALPLPASQDRRLARICDALRDNPADPRTLAEWALEAGASSRTLARLFQAHTGVSFVHWRQQARLLYALPRLAAGEPVATIAAALGYDTPGAFAAMFRRYTGTTPSQYFRMSDPA